MHFKSIKTQTAKCFYFITAFIVCNLFFNFHTAAQSTYISPGDKLYDLLDRLEIKTGWQGNIFSQVKPYKRIDAVNYVQTVDSLEHLNSAYGDLSDVDKYDMQCLLMDNSEWSKPNDFYLSKQPVFGSNGIYKTKANLFELNKPDLFLAVNPVVYFAVAKEKNNDASLYQNSRGISARAIIDSKIGIDLFFTDNQERDPSYVMQYVVANKALPGVGNYKIGQINKNSKLDYFDARASLSWRVNSNIDMQFGFDKNIIGDGYRSLLLSNFSNSATFLKTNFHIWKLNYQNILMELYTPHETSGNIIFPKKYARFSDLSINACKWFNIGIFDGTVFDTKNNFNLQYLVPVIFFKPFGSSGNNANEIVGIHAKANLVNHVQLYGQAIFDELNLNKAFSNSWNNKSGFQLGLKYIDAFGFQNLDLQAEINQVRPFTYAYNDSVANYTHYNQPIAHPLGANFREFNFIAKVQPLKKLYIQAVFTHYFKGLDSAGIDFGGNIFQDYNNRTGDDNYTVGIGNRATTNYLYGVVSYEIKENMFLELSGIYRTYKLASINTDNNSTTVYLSFRWNIARRDFNF